MTGAQPVEVTGVWHFSFTVSDLAVSVAFYRDLLGFDVVHTQQQDNPYTRRLVGYADASLHIAQLRVPGQAPAASGHHLELVQYLSPVGSRGDDNICNPGAGHLALQTTDIHAAFEHLSARGVTFVSPPNEITAGINRGGFACYFKDPDNIVLELVQPPTTKETS